MEDRIIISIILFIQQGSIHLRECIDSILSQHFKGWELICVANNNDRISLDVIHSYKEKVRIVTADDLYEMADAVNRTLEIVNGQYFMFLHPDDFCMPDFLERGVEAAESTQSQVVVFESGERSPQTGVLRQRFISLQKQILPGKIDFSPAEVRGNYLRVVRLPSWLTFYKKKYWQGLGLQFSGDCRTNDRWLGMCAIAAAERVCAVHEPLAYLHLGKDSFVDTATEMAKVFTFLKEKDLFKEAGYQFAHSFLTDIVRYLKTANSDFQRFEILDYLCTDSFRSMEILDQPPEWYRYRISVFNGTFISAACRRYTMQQINSFCNNSNVEEIIPVRMKTEIKVSVIIPVFNSEDYLNEAIQSVADQSLKEIEILCMDDGSTDGSFSILKNWAETDRRIGIYQQKNAGPSVARNQLLNYARGQYILYLDSDDVLATDALENLFRTAENEKLDLLIYNGINFYNEDLPVGARKVREGKFIIEDYRGVCSGSEMLVKLQEHKDLYSSAGVFLINRLFLEKEVVQFHEGILHEDTPYTFELLLKANRVDYLKTTFYKRRLRNNSITTGMKQFDHCYGTYLGYLDMCNVFRQREKQLDEREKGAARYRIQWMLNIARERYMQMSESFVGEEYGLCEDFTGFHALVGSYCEQLRQKKEMEEKFKEITMRLDSLQMRVTNAKLSNTEARLQETENRLNDAKVEIASLKGSISYQIGRFITWPLRKLRGLLRFLN